MPSGTKQWLAGACVPLFTALHAQAEDLIRYGHETYVEDDGRMRVDTETTLFRKTLSPWLDLAGGAVYDSISGATPIGAPPLKNISLRSANVGLPVPNKSIKGFTRKVDGVSGASPSANAAAVSRTVIPTAESRDYRTAFNLAADFSFGNQHLTPAIDYSHERDYVSYAGSLNYAIDLNEKNTTLAAGWSHASDVIRANQFTFITADGDKNTDDFLLGVTQLLGPKTILSVTGTYGYSHGYLNDPYRAVVFQETPLNAAGQLMLYGEKRPNNRQSGSLFLQLTQAIEPMHASVEGSYRYYQDSYEIQAHTADIAWFQKLGPAIVISPSFRYYFQQGASFYATQFSGDPAADRARVPSFYSSDYRLSHFASYTLGVDATWKVREHLDLRIGYHRYIMRGLDRVTAQSTYPKASIFTAGLDLVF